MEDNNKEELLKEHFYADLDNNEQGYKWHLVDSGVHESVDIYTKFSKEGFIETKYINVPIEFFRKMFRDLGVTRAEHQSGYMVRNIQNHEVLKYINDQGRCETMEHTFFAGGEDLKRMLISAIKHENEPNTQRFDMDKGEFSFEMRDGLPVISLKVRDTGRRNW